MDMGDQLTRQHMRDAIDNAQLEFGLAVDCDDFIELAYKHLGPQSPLAQIRRELALTIDLKG